MLVGHFAVGLLVKRTQPEISLGTAVLASMLADLLWALFLLTGIEQVRFRPEWGAANYLAAINIAFSHSLLMDVIWAALLALAFFRWQHSPRGAWLIFVAVLSHWVLDLASHRPDMPLMPGIDRFYGFGLWTSIPATLILEGGCWLLAIVLYLRSTQAHGRAAVLVFWIGAAILTLAWYSNITGPPPQSVRSAGSQSLIFFSACIAWAYWMNGLRPASAHGIHD